MQTHRYSLGSVISELRTLQSRTAGIYSFVQVEVRPLESACLRFEVLRICSCLLFNSTSLLSAQTMNAQQEGAYTYQQKVMLLKSRYKSSKDLWLFMTERCKYSLAFLLVRPELMEFQHQSLLPCTHSHPSLVGYLLPSLRATRLQFLQDIVSGKK